MGEYLLRFCLGGLIVSLFAVLGDIFRPKSFAGLFGAAPSIAICTMALALWDQNPAYIAAEGRSMMIGAAALCIYTILVCQLLKRWRWHAAIAATASLMVWLGVALGGKWLLPGG